ncbi:MAG: hypothetical protein IPK82_00860 [Polyangiaceae bacterium]|nr:hypothetical protein [Polyangiaceae bacterium]
MDQLAEISKTVVSKAVDSVVEPIAEEGVRLAGEGKKLADEGKKKLAEEGKKLAEDGVRRAGRAVRFAEGTLRKVLRTGQPPRDPKKPQ